uniref:F-box domain-containing protein n=1 Tax=Tetranychus urticae TaxID=32264 RepID=T1JQ48_TETUR
MSTSTPPKRIIDLDEDCLLEIFSHIHDLQGLISLCSIGERWKAIIYKNRLKSVKYLMRFDSNREPKLAKDTVYFHGYGPLIVTDQVNLFPNIEVLDLRAKLDKKLNENDILHFVNKANKLKGLIQEGRYFSEEIIKKCENLEMLATTGTHLGPYLEEYVCKIKQLKLRCYSLDELSHNPRNLCNLERPNISVGSVGMYNGPKLMKLKILEMSFTSKYGFEFLNYCPGLESVYLLIKSNKHIVSGSTNRANGSECSQEWSSLWTLLVRYPNLKHLALRGNSSIFDIDVKELVALLPNLELVDFRKCDGITVESLNFVQKFSAMQNRVINLYCNVNEEQMKVDLPHLSYDPDCIVKEFDLMRHCFAKDFENLPYFIGV